MFPADCSSVPFAGLPMLLRINLPLGIVTLFASLVALGEEPKPYAGLCTATIDSHFVDEVWTKVGAQKCLNCHKAGGDAEESKFLLRDPMRVSGDERAAALIHNQRA